MGELEQEIEQLREKLMDKIDVRLKNEYVEKMRKMRRFHRTKIVFNILISRPMFVDIEGQHLLACLIHRKNLVKPSICTNPRAVRKALKNWNQAWCEAGKKKPEWWSPPRYIGPDGKGI